MANWIAGFFVLIIKYVAPVLAVFTLLYFKILYSSGRKSEAKEISYNFSKILTVPNVITFVGIILVLLGVYFYSVGKTFLTVVCFILSGISDVLDGWLAGVLNQKSRLGEILDPIRDRALLIGALLIFIHVIDFETSALLSLAVLFLAEAGIIFLGLKYASVMHVHSAGKSRQAIHLFFICLIFLNKFDLVFWDYLRISGNREESQIILMMALFSILGFFVYLKKSRQTIN